MSKLLSNYLILFLKLKKKKQKSLSSRKLLNCKLMFLRVFAALGFTLVVLFQLRH